MSTERGLRIDPADLDPDTLRGVVEEFVTRDGTNLAEADAKIRQVLAQLERGTAEIWFDQATRTCGIFAV